MTALPSLFQVNHGYNLLGPLLARHQRPAVSSDHLIRTLLSAWGGRNGESWSKGVRFHNKAPVNGRDLTAEPEA